MTDHTVTENRWTQFIHARLAEGEQAAHATGPHAMADQWTAVHHRTAMSMVKSGQAIIAGDLSDELANHIALHDPSRVLDQVKAIRKILDAGPSEAIIRALAGIWSEHSEHPRFDPPPEQTITIRSYDTDTEQQ